MQTPLDFTHPQVQQVFKEAQELMAVRGRDSRIVRAALAYSLWKKRLLARLTQQVRGLSGWQAKRGPLRIFYWLPGGLGDAACARRLVLAYRALLPQAEFDVYCPLPGVAQTLFGAQERITCLPHNRVYYKNYDLVVRACLAVEFLYADELRLRACNTFWPVYERAVKAQRSLGSLLDDTFLTEPVLGRALYRAGGTRFDLLRYTGGTELAADLLPVPKKAGYGLDGKKYITFHDGTSTAQALPTAPTRAWPREKWRAFLRAFKAQYPDITIVQVGGPNSPVYEEADCCLVRKTALTDLPGLLAHALVHVDTESGLVHLASMLPLRSVVLFGPSDVRFFAYDKNSNLSAGPCGGCMWMTRDWMFACPLNRPAGQRCMAQLTVETVLDAVQRVLVG